MMKVKDITCGYGFTIFAVNDSKAHLYGTGLNKDGQIGMDVLINICQNLKYLPYTALLGKNIFFKLS